MFACTAFVDSIYLSLMAHVFMQIFFMQRVMRMNFVRTTMLEQEQLQLITSMQFVTCLPNRVHLSRH